MQLNQADLIISFSGLFEYDAFEGAIDELKILNKALSMQAKVNLASPWLGLLLCVLHVS